MAYDAAAGKFLVRATVHNTFALDALYRSVLTPLDEPKELRVRWHNKVTPRGNHGDLLDLGYPDVIEGVDTVIFNSDQIISEAITLRRGDTITFLSPRFDGITLELQQAQPRNGPQEFIWQVAQL